MANLHHEDITQKKQSLEDKYNVKINVVKQSVDCYKYNNLEAAHRNNTFPISEEDLDVSIKITEILIQFKQVGLQIATQAASLKAEQSSLILGVEIKKIREEFFTKFNKEPSLRIIANKLTEKKILTSNGKDKWNASSVRNTEKHYKKLISSQ